MSATPKLKKVKVSPESIEVDQPRNYLIIEHTIGMMFQKGAMVYCGACGQPVGEMNKKLLMPFMPEVFLKALKNSSVTWTAMGLHHHTCQHVLFPTKRSFDFIRLEDWNTQVAKEKDKQKPN